MRQNGARWLCVFLPAPLAPSPRLEDPHLAEGSDGHPVFFFVHPDALQSHELPGLPGWNEKARRKAQVCEIMRKRGERLTEDLMAMHDDCIGE